MRKNRNGNMVAFIYGKQNGQMVRNHKKQKRVRKGK